MFYSAHGAENGQKMKHFRFNKGFQATAHNLSLCNRFPSLQSFILMPVGRRLNPDVRHKTIDKIWRLGDGKENIEPSRQADG